MLAAIPIMPTITPEKPDKDRNVEDFSIVDRICFRSSSLALVSPINNPFIVQSALTFKVYMAP